MSSISVSDYRTACSELIQNAIERPMIYYRTLKEFEFILLGHQVAYDQFGATDTSTGFHRMFTHWLCETQKVFGQSGWYCALEQLAEREHKTEEELFQSLAPEFLAGWDK